MIINQPFGIGDIIFLEPLFRYYWEKNGRKPVLPVRDHLLGLHQYFESVAMIPLSTSQMDIDNTVMRPNYLPLRFANQILRGYAKFDHHDLENMMLDKYRIVDLNPRMWTNVKLKLDYNKAALLSAMVMNEAGMEPGDEYILVNNNSGVGVVDIKPKSHLPVIRMRPIAGFTMIDWHTLIFNAKENHHVSTSTFYLFQAILNDFYVQNLSPNLHLFIYPRPNDDGLRGISKLEPQFTYTPMP